MTRHWSRQQRLLLIWGSMAVGMTTTVLAIVLMSPALMLLSIAFSALMGIMLFRVVSRGRAAGSSRPFRPPGTRL